VFDNSDDATSRVVFNSVVEIGLEKLVGSSQAFINFTRDFILSGNCTLLPRDKVVLEILEDSVADPEFLRGISALRSRGYRFAVDDYTFQEQLQPFLPYCSYIKVDLRQVDRDQLVREMPSLLQLPAALLAEKVETEEEFEYCKALGFQYFQGYFFCRPKIVSVTTMPTSRLSLCKLLSKLYQADVTSAEVEAIIGDDPALSYRLQRYINSASLGISRKIESIKHAVRMVGLNHIRTLASMVMLSSLEDKPRELFKTSLIRARMCQILGEGPAKEYDTYFTIGLFSTLDAFLNCSMEAALELLPLSDEIQEALLRGKGQMGRILSAVKSFEEADWTTLDRFGVDSRKVAQSYLDAIRWGEETPL
jgi:EAL and modified HD-GYP domain-containing signal transduction protein